LPRRTTNAAASAGERRKVDLELVVGRAHYDALLMKTLARAHVSVWIATANVKGLRVEAPIGTRARARGRYVSVLDLFDDLHKRGVELRLLHAGVPSAAFRADLAAHPTLAKGGLAMRRCPRVHLKMIAVDGAALYLGSANFTGAGLGAKSDRRRNFEVGVLTDDDVLLDSMQSLFDRIWRGTECARCAVRPLCPKPLDTLGKPAAKRAAPRAHDDGAARVPKPRPRVARST
jgi:phosphatidylserine/phosphatidylglycerophosphate/cardiolipin synthase-like enzyme